MNKRLINFRGTAKFAYVDIKKSGTKPKKVSMAWASCIKSIKDINKPVKVDFGDHAGASDDPVFNINSQFGTLYGNLLTPTRIWFKQPCLPQYQNTESE